MEIARMDEQAISAQLAETSTRRQTFKRFGALALGGLAFTGAIAATGAADDDGGRGGRNRKRRRRNRRGGGGGDND